ncbi:MAG: ribonuclease E/G [Alphaproteobacteria bacterium]|nr:ribonuclease E/G [Alphaproteobacteria bacterium]
MAVQPQIYIMLNVGGKRHSFAQIAKYDGDGLSFYDIWPLDLNPENIQFSAAKTAIGSLYKARITKIDSKTQLAFLSLGKLDAVLQLKPKQTFTEGQYILAEIISEAHDDKNPRMRYMGEVKADGKNKPSLFKPAENLAQYCLKLAKQQACQITCDDFAFCATLTQQAAIDDVKIDLNQAQFGKKHDENLFEKHGLMEQIDELDQSQLQLENGGNIIIEHTAAMTVVDVNSGNYNGNDMIKNINSQAAQKLFAQLALRHIGGLVIVDFLKPKTKPERLAFAAYLRDLCKSYKIEMGSYTALGLAEFKIKRSGKCLSEKLLDIL